MEDKYSLEHEDPFWKRLEKEFPDHIDLLCEFNNGGDEGLSHILEWVRIYGWNEAVKRYRINEEEYMQAEWAEFAKGKIIEHNKEWDKWLAGNQEEKDESKADGQGEPGASES